MIDSFLISLLFFCLLILTFLQEAERERNGWLEVPLVNECTFTGYCKKE